jgi:hypothetical protein
LPHLPEADFLQGMPEITLIGKAFFALSQGDVKKMGARKHCKVSLWQNW